MTIRLNPANLSQTRSDLGLGDAATKTVGTGNGNVIVADATGLPAIDASQVTNLNAANIATGTVPTARLGSGASSTNFLRGDGTFAEAGLTEKIMEVSATESDNADYLTLTPTTGFYDSTYDSMWIEGDVIRPSVNDRYLQYQLAYKDTSDATQYRTSTSRYRDVSTARLGTGEQHQANTFNTIGVTTSSSYYFDSKAGNKNMGRVWIDLSWFCNRNIAGIDKTTDDHRPLIHFRIWMGEASNNSNTMWHEGVSHHYDSIGAITNAVKWCGIRFYFSSSAKISGVMRLMGRK